MSEDTLSNIPKKPLYKCAKCEHNVPDIGEIRTAGGMWSSLFDFSNKRFTYVSCAKCGHTEFYRKHLAQSSRILDFLFS